MRVLAIYIAVVLSLYCKSQDSIGNTFSAEQFLAVLQQYHPIAKQAQLNIDFADAGVTSARGGFDPQINTYITDKVFNNTPYYKNIDVNVVIPAWYGISVEAGTQNITGDRIDPMITEGKTSYIGINIPLLKNLVLDKRRATLQKAKIYQDLSYVEQRSILNNLGKEAMDAYWSWVYSHQHLEVILNTIKTNELRFVMVKKAFANGERPAIDTIEALTQLQYFQLQGNQATLELQNSLLLLSAYLWTQDNNPYILPQNTKPHKEWDTPASFTGDDFSLDTLLNITQQHPELLEYDFKIDALTVDKKLSFQEMLPKLDFSYYQLGKGYNFINTIAEGPLFRNNFQYAIKFQMPLTFAQGRGQYKQTQIVIQQTEFDQNIKQNNIQIKVKSYFNEYVFLKKQIALQTTAYSNYEKLVRAEEIKFFNGESNLFLINTRENKSLENLLKLIELKTKYFKTIYALKWSTGTIF